MKLLIIDNYDSFTFNLFQYFGELIEKKFTGGEIKVIRNDEFSIEGILDYNPTHLVISPGPGNPQYPKYFGVCAEAIKTLGPKIPTLGVCLGMQGISFVFGGEVVHADVPMHGKISPVVHHENDLFAGLPQELEIMRYHSLVVKRDTLPECLEITSLVSPEVEGKSLEELIKDDKYNDLEIMGVKHKEFPIFGIQYHPESFGTEGGIKMLENFLKL
jgi:anthranilate synthase/aminodeoxychorismate synthase-like glutamine amidotransferase